MDLVNVRPWKRMKGLRKKGLLLKNNKDMTPIQVHLYQKRSLLNRGTASSTTSPLKKSKSQMVKVMQKIHATLENMMMSKVSPMLHEHARMYPNPGLGPLFQELIV
jgi:hypothetical protein